MWRKLEETDTERAELLRKVCCASGCNTTFLLWGNGADRFPPGDSSPLNSPTATWCPHLLLTCSQAEFAVLAALSSRLLLLILYLDGHQEEGPSRFAWSSSMFLRFFCLCCWALGFCKAPRDNLGCNFLYKIETESKVVAKYNRNLTERFDFPSLSVTSEFTEVWFSSGGSSAADHVVTVSHTCNHWSDLTSPPAVTVIVHCL